MLTSLFGADVFPTTEEYHPPTYNIVEGEYKIMPGDLPTKFDHLWDAFDHSETEISAKYILHFCQSRGEYKAAPLVHVKQGSWAPFTYDEIEAFYRRSGHKGFTFNHLVEPGWRVERPGVKHLIGGGWIVQKDDKFYITDDFILRLAQSLAKQ